MMTPYTVRLLCLSLAAFFVIHTGAGLLVALCAPAAVRAAQRMRARRAAGFLLALRLLPPMLALSLVGGVCVPSYLLLEQDGGVETVGALCIAAAILTLCLWTLSIARSVSAAKRSMRHARDWERTGARAQMAGASRPVLTVDSPVPVLALAGVFRPELVIARIVAEALSAEQLRAALRHEEAHRSSRDNLKRLLLLLSPGLLPGWNGLRVLERGWSRFSEWAADDEAVAGDPRASLALAAALVRIARMGGTPAPTPLSVNFLADGRDLSIRVDRLLHPVPLAPAPSPSITGTAMAFALAFVAAAMHPSTFESAHRLLEHLVH